MQEISRICLNYEVSGMHVCDDGMSTADDININVMEIVPGRAYNLLGHIEIVRIPSDLRSINIERVDAGYGMANVMMAERDAMADVVAHEMRLQNPDIKAPCVRTLKENDMYVIKFFQITKNRRGQGYGSYVLSKLPAALSRITNDRRPVIAVVPYAPNKPEDDERVKNFFTKNGYKPVTSNSQTLYYC